MGQKLDLGVGDGDPDGFALEIELGSERAGQGLPRRTVRPQAGQRLSDKGERVRRHSGTGEDSGFIPEAAATRNLRRTAYGVKETLRHTDPVVRWTATLRRLSLALYLYYDHLVWLAKNEIIASEKRLPSYSRRSNQWWLCSLIVGLLRDVYEIRSILAKSKATCDFQGASEILCRNKGVFCDLLVNACDASIP